MAKNTVDNHPTVSEFLNSVETYNCPNVSSFVSLFEETVLGFDLEKQIEEIGRFADTSRSRSPDDCPLGFRKDAVDLMGQVRHRTIASHGSFVHDQGPPSRNNSRRTTRSQRKVQVEAEVIPPPSQPVIPDRTHLSPLGARAALASLMYKLPSDSEFSASKLNSTISLDLASKYLDPDYADPFDLARPEIHTSERREAANKCLQGTVQLNRLEKSVWTPNDREDMGSEVVSVQRSSTQSQSGRKMGTPRSANRFTRSTIQKGSSLSTDEVELKSSPEDAKLCVPMRTPRLTRSSVQKEIKNVTVDVSEGMQERSLAQATDFKLTRQAKQKEVSPSNDEIELKTSSEEMKISSPTNTPRLTRSTIQKEIRNGTVGVNNGLHERKSAQNTDSRLNRKAVRHSDDNIEAKTSYEEMELPNGAKKLRFTRSAKQKEVTVLEENELAQQARSDSSREDHVTPPTKETRREKPLISSDEGINLSLPRESNKRRSEGETPNASARRRRRSENDPATSGTKPVLRSSPRLTRSQKE